MTQSILEEARVYACAASQARTNKLPKQLARLHLPYVIDRQLPVYELRATQALVMDAASQRFRQQITSDVDRPLLWLEDDIAIPYNFREIWSHYESTLPEDWSVAVIGWGIIHYRDDTKVRCVTPGWWHLEGSDVKFSGSQAVLVNRGDWRLKLKDMEFRCDTGLVHALSDIGVTTIYHTDTVLIGTNDIETTHGGAIIQYPTLSTPCFYYIKPSARTRTLVESDFVGEIIPINRFTYMPPVLTRWIDNVKRIFKRPPKQVAMDFTQ